MSYVPPAKRTAVALANATSSTSSGTTEARWAKSVKPEHKTISISSLEDFPALVSTKSSTKSNMISHTGSMSLAEKLKKSVEEEKLVEAEKAEYEKENARKQAEYDKEYASIQARSLHKKLFRKYAEDISGNTHIENELHEEDEETYEEEFDH